MSKLCWLAADYHFPSTYSIRVPGSSMTNTRAMPAPGPGTVRLAMIRAGIELFGSEYIRNELFHDICSMQIRISPPEYVSISPQILRVYKAVPDKFGRVRYNEGIAIREYAHAKGHLSVFIQVSISLSAHFAKVLENIGYWGESGSLTFCENVGYREPRLGLYGAPLEEFVDINTNLYSCFVTDFKHSKVEWWHIVTSSLSNKETPIQFLLYVWPLELCERRGGHLTLHRCSPTNSL